jgi:hypothetical protein
MSVQTAWSIFCGHNPWTTRPNQPGWPFGTVDASKLNDGKHPPEMSQVRHFVGFCERFERVAHLAVS